MSKEIRVNYLSSNFIDLSSKIIARDSNER